MDRKMFFKRYKDPILEILIFRKVIIFEVTKEIFLDFEPL